MLIFFAQLIATAALAQPHSIDLASIKGKGVSSLEICKTEYQPDSVTPTGHRIKMLGAAYVFFGPTNGVSVLGHAAERFVYCHDDQINDVLFEYAKPDESAFDPPLFEYQNEVKLSDYSPDEQKAWRQSLFVSITMDPIISSYGTSQINANRSINEVWFNGSGKAMHEMLNANIAHYHEQLDNIKNHRALPEYSAIHNNCTLAVRNDLEIIAPDFVAKHNPLKMTPEALFRKIAKKGSIRGIIHYPSQTELRLLEGESLHRALKGAFPHSWMLFFDPHRHGLKKWALSPFIGAANLIAGVAETVSGIVKPKRFKEGIRDVALSIPEIFWLRARYPEHTAWTNEELEFLKSLDVKPALESLLLDTSTP